MATRSYQQRARKFLSEAFKNDAFDKSEPLAKAMPIFRFIPGEPHGSEEHRVHALQFIVFVETRKHVCRLPLRRERGADPKAKELLREPMFFMATTADELLVEAIAYSDSCEERCVAVASLPLNKSGPVDLRFRRSTVSMKLINQATVPDLGDVILTMHGEITCLAQDNLRTHMSGLYPPFTCVSASTFDPQQAMRTCKIRVSGLNIAHGKNHPEGTFSTRIVLHNGFREIEVFDELVTLQPKAAGMPLHVWDSSKNFEFARVPLLPSTHVVVLVYFCARGDKFATPIGVAAYPATVDAKDQDVDLRNLGVLNGPYSSCDISRCLAAAGGHWFAPRDPSVSISLKLEYFNTGVTSTVTVASSNNVPVPTTAEAVVPARKSKSAPPPTGPVAANAVVDGNQVQPPNTAVVPDSGEVKPSTPTAHPPVSAPESAPRQTIMETRVSVESAVMPDQVLAMQSSIHQMLKELSDEVHKIKAAIDTPGAAAAADVQRKADAAEQERLKSLGVEIMSLAPKRVALGHSTRAKMLSGIRPLINPFTQQRLDDGNLLSSTALQATAVALRFDGVTIPRAQVGFPKNLELRFSFGAEASNVLGPASLSLCGEDGDVGQTFSLLDMSASSARGLVWNEKITTKVSPHENQLLLKYKRGNGSLYVQLFDAASQFYVASASIPNASFERSANVRHSSLSLDVPLQWDSTAAAGGKHDAMAHPLAAGSIGVVHVTVGVIGFALEADQGASHATKDPTLQYRDVNAPQACSSRVVEVKRLPSSLSHLDNASASPKDAPSTSNGGAIPHAVPETIPSSLRHMPPDRQELHMMRALHIKQALQSNTAIPSLLNKNGVGASASRGASATGGADRVELDLRLKMVEKKREELKGTIIAERLRERIKSRFDVSVSRGVPAVVSAEFVNPFHCTMNFVLSFPDGQAASSDALARPTLDVRRAFGKSFGLAPQERTVIPLIVRHDAPSTQGAVSPLCCNVSTERGELIKQFEVNVTVAKPMITRRHGIYGDSGSTQIRSLYLRSFTAQTLGKERMQMDGLVKLAGNLCTWPVCASPSIEVDTKANIDPFAVGCAAAWETVSITARIPSSGTTTALVHLYANDAREDHIETWEIELGLCTTVAAPDVYLGESTALTLPIACDHVFAFSGACSAAPARSAVGGAVAQSTSLVVKPIQAGKHSILLHAFSGGSLMRYAVNFNASPPVPTHAVQLTLGPDELTVPVFRRLGIDNMTDKQRSFSLTCTYQHVASLSATVLSDMAANERRYVTLTLRNLSPGQRYPVFVFVNDAQIDKTVESFLIDVTVSTGHIVAINSQ